MTEREQDGVLAESPTEWLQNMCKILAQKIKKIGDEFDIVAK
jgi:hypothetical protein